ncbi:hypothetical protein [Paraglaciecola sp. MB-3u-78]|uniref:hypothetical protein n=1 Tax=Paraglaciecola sp. MB-3u-78 TaxID=2058332 RepID=UPI001E2DB977|nr:hypothetical protein [Paraglaciecola sp. MB-3u-78]
MSAAFFLKTASALGDLQILPKQTKSTEVVLAAIGFPKTFPMQSILAVYNCASSGKTD